MYACTHMGAGERYAHIEVLVFKSYKTVLIFLPSTFLTSINDNTGVHRFTTPRIPVTGLKHVKVTMPKLRTASGKRLDNGGRFSLVHGLPTFTLCFTHRLS